MAKKISVGQYDVEQPKQFIERVLLPSGTYQVVVKNVDVKEYGENSKQAGEEFMNLQLAVEESPTGKYIGAVLFESVYPSPVWGSGKSNFGFYNFYGTVLGFANGNELQQAIYNKEIDDLELPFGNELIGYQFEVEVGQRTSTYRLNRLVKEFEEKLRANGQSDLDEELIVDGEVVESIPSEDDPRAQENYIKKFTLVSNGDEMDVQVSSAPAKAPAKAPKTKPVSAKPLVAEKPALKRPARRL